jgi:hypothetical protein
MVHPQLGLIAVLALYHRSVTKSLSLAGQGLQGWHA